MGVLTNLEKLYLAGNALTGCVPPGLRGITDSDLADLGLPFCGAEATTGGATTPCANGVAVPNPQANSGLVADCTALLLVRDTLAGSATLNWSTDRPIADWDGITIGGSPPRVIEVDLSERKLTGMIPPQLAELINLQVLDLLANQLSGPIPPQNWATLTQL